MAVEVELEDMIVDLIGVLVKSSKGIDGVVSAVGHRGIDKTCRSLAQGFRDLGTVAIEAGPVLDGRVGHDVGVVGRAI